MARNREIHNMRRRYDRAFEREYRARQRAGAGAQDLARMRSEYQAMRAATMQSVTGRGKKGAEARTKAFAAIESYLQGTGKKRTVGDVTRSREILKAKMRYGLVAPNKAVSAAMNSAFWASTRKIWNKPGISKEQRLDAVFAWFNANKGVNDYGEMFNLVMGEVSQNPAAAYVAGTIDMSGEQWDLVVGSDVPGRYGEDPDFTDFIKQIAVMYG